MVLHPDQWNIASWWEHDLNFHRCMIQHLNIPGFQREMCIRDRDYTVDVRSGEFLVGETVSIFRGDSATSANRIGRGELTRKSPTAVTGTGSIVSFAVADGDSVEPVSYTNLASCTCAKPARTASTQYPPTVRWRRAPQSLRWTIPARATCPRWPWSPMKNGRTPFQ